MHIEGSTDEENNSYPNMEVLETANIITIQDGTTNKAKQDLKIPDNYLDYERRTQGFLKQQRSTFLNNQRNRSYRGTTSETHAEGANEAQKMKWPKEIPKRICSRSALTISEE